MSCRQKEKPEELKPEHANATIPAVLMRKVVVGAIQGYPPKTDNDPWIHGASVLARFLSVTMMRTMIQNRRLQHQVS